MEDFIKKWFPKTEEWENIGNFILESGIKIVAEPVKWLPGYTNISKCSKPHHLDIEKRFMEEQMFMLHDLVHNIFTVSTSCSEKEYVDRQIYGELITFYLTEFVIPLSWGNKYRDYLYDRGCLSLMSSVKSCALQYHKNIIDFMYDTFINNIIYSDFERLKVMMNQEAIFEKYSKMFKGDLKASRENYKILPKNISNYCMVGKTSKNHLDFLEAVKVGALKNIKRNFNLELPEEWK